MTAPTLLRPEPATDSRGAPPAATEPPGRGRSPAASVSDDLLTIALLLLVLAALLPFQRIYIGPEWVRPVVGSAVLSLGIGWGARKLGVGPITHLLMTSAGLLVFVTIAFLPATAAAGLLPTVDTLTAVRDLFVRGLELVEVRPSPTFAEAGLLLLTVAGVWIVAYLADGMLFVLRSATKAIATVVVLWSVPLAVAPPDGPIARDTAGLLVTAGILLVLANTSASGAWGRRISGAHERRPILPLSGWVMVSIATAAGVLLAGVLPGYEADPIYTVRGSTGTTITTNPIVNIQERLVASNTGPVVRLDSPRPMYLRTTSLDTFNEREEWGLSGTIGGSPVRGRVDDAPPIPTEVVQATILIEGIESGAILAPTPYQTIEVAGSRAQDMRYETDSATLTLPGDEPLVRGDSYRVTAALPQPSPEALRQVARPPAGPLTALPPTVPQIAIDLANEIIATAGATTMFDQALAIQDRLRTWDYRTSPEFGPGSTAMERFINGRQGYCEQFAGTMAVMLRSLGIPARLAVGYTPGTLQPDGLWEVTNANAHAWVEVNFGELGWISFEPTPRSDGNVLVPSGTSVVPSQTVAAAGADGEFEPFGPGEIPQARPSQDPRLGEEPLVPLGSEAAQPGGAAGGAGGGIPGWLVLAVLGSAGAGLLLLRRQRGSGGLVPPPEARIERARLRAERAGTAVGLPRRAHETDHEYFARITDGGRAGAALAAPATRADYAPAVSEADARLAETAAIDVRHRLLADAGWLTRAKLRAHDLLAR